MSLDAQIMAGTNELAHDEGDLLGDPSFWCPTEWFPATDTPCSHSNSNCWVCSTRCSCAYDAGKETAAFTLAFAALPPTEKLTGGRPLKGKGSSQGLHGRVALEPSAESE